jgi:hypothetical protein
VRRAASRRVAKNDTENEKKKKGAMQRIATRRSKRQRKEGNEQRFNREETTKRKIMDWLLHGLVTNPSDTPILKRSTIWKY